MMVLMMTERFKTPSCTEFDICGVMDVWLIMK